MYPHFDRFSELALFINRPLWIRYATHSL